MVTKIELIRNIAPDFHFRYPLPEVMEDLTSYGYEFSKIGNTLNLTINITYKTGDFYSEERYEVTKYKATYEIVTDGQDITPEGIYPAIAHSITTMNVFLGPLVKSGKIPQKYIVCPPLSHLQADLQAVVDWFHSRL